MDYFFLDPVTFNSHQSSWCHTNRQESRSTRCIPLG